MNYSFDLDITPGGMPPILHMSQYDTARIYTANLKNGSADFEPGSGATAKVKGFNGKVCFDIPATISGSAVTFQLTEASTDQYGIFPVTIEIAFDNPEDLTPLCMIFDIQKSGYTNEQAASSPEFEDAMEAAIEAYLADHPVGMSDEVKLAILNCFAHVAWAGTDGETYYTDLYNALYPSVSPVSISAVYTQSGTVYPYYSLDQLKPDLVVTVHYSDDTSATTNAYTLSGSLTVGTSAITVTYGGLTTTFNVTVTASPVPAGYTPLQYVERPTDAAANTCFNTTGFTPNGTDDLVVNMTVELLAAPSSSSGGYFLACRQNNSGNTLGFGIFVPQDATSIGTYDGESCLIEPEGSGISIIGKKYSLTVTKTPTTITVTDGTNTNTVTRTPRAMANALSVFGLISTSSQLNVPICGRIYALEATEGTTLKLKFIPCKRDSDNAVGFWNPVASEFKTAAYTAGPVL